MAACLFAFTLRRAAPPLRPLAGGYITTCPCAASRPNASNLNFTLGATIPNLVAVAVDASGGICLYTDTATHLIWVQSVEEAAASTESKVRKSPRRIMDTR